MKFLDYFISVPSEDIPHNSLLREFVGGSCLMYRNLDDFFLLKYIRVRITLVQAGQVIAAVQTKGCRRGKSGLQRAGCRITSGGGDSQTSATEINRLLYGR